jgi:predicted DNA-binding transcriptional regulator AlpA
MRIDVSEAQALETLVAKLLSAAAKVPLLEAELKRLSDAVAAKALTPLVISAPTQDDDDQLLAAGAIVGLLACSRVSLWRRIKAGTFPPPDLHVGPNRYWRKSTYRAHIAKQAAEKKSDAHQSRQRAVQKVMIEKRIARKLAPIAARPEAAEAAE